MWIFLITSLMMSSNLVIYCQMPKKPPTLTLVDDLPFISCEVCKKGASSIFKNVRDKRKEIGSAKFGEEAIIGVVEKSCNPETNDGLWITKLDIVETQNGLDLVTHPKAGRCKEECKTIGRACDDTIGEVDTDVGEILWQNELKLSAFINKVCYELSNVCKKKKPKFKKGKRKDHKFIEMSEKEMEAMKTMRKMKDVPGMPGMEMYSREDVEAMRDQMGIPSNNEEETNKEESEQEEIPPENFKTQLTFFDYVKIMGRNAMSKIKSIFGYETRKKKEL